MDIDAIDGLTWRQINEIVQMSADCLDRANAQGYADLFTTDGTLEFAPGKHAQGREAIQQLFSEDAARYASAHHHVGPPRITAVKEGGLITATSYLSSVLELHDGSRVSIWGRYVDEITTEAQVLILKRRMVIHFSDGAATEFFSLERVHQIDAEQPSR
jgi:ketosteroid isomerase-like protein